MDGFILCELIKKLDKIHKTRPCPVIAITACISNDIDIKAK